MQSDLLYLARLSSSSDIPAHLHYNNSFSKLSPYQDLVCCSAAERLTPYLPHPVSVSEDTNIILSYSELLGIIRQIRQKDSYREKH